MVRESRDGEVTPGLSSLDTINIMGYALFITIVNVRIILMGALTNAMKSTHAHLSLV